MSESQRERTSLIGRTFRPDVGGTPLVVVDEDDRFVYVKSASWSRRALSTRAGAHIVSRLEFAVWTEVAK